MLLAQKSAPVPEQIVSGVGFGGDGSGGYADG